MLRVSAPRFQWSPAAAWLFVLAAIFATEYAVMLLLPLMTDRSSQVVEAAVDAVTLVVVISPIIWWTVVRPLREVIRLRTRFLTELFARIEADRRQTAYELHDGIGQSLSILVSGLRSAQAATREPEKVERYQQLIDLAKTALQDVKRLALGLRPSLLDDLGLVPAVERLVADIRANHPARFTLDIGDLDHNRLGDAVETAVFRIVQEALTNVVRHARASTASVVIRRHDNQVDINVQDDGCGIADHQAQASGNLGLLGMRERATLLGGTFAVQSSPGQGTRVTATIPLIG